MRLSLTIAATLATIAGSVIAAPGPLLAHALEQVTLFQRDVDIYSRGNQATTDILLTAMHATHTAIGNTQSAVDHGPPNKRDEWSHLNAYFKGKFSELKAMQEAHRKAATQNDPTDLLDKVTETSALAKEVLQEAHQANMRAQKEVRDYNDEKRQAARLTAHNLHRAVASTHSVIRWTAKAAQQAKFHGLPRDMWCRHQKHHMEMLPLLKNLHREHSEDANKERPATLLNGKTAQRTEFAVDVRKSALKTSKLARQAIYDMGRVAF